MNEPARKENRLWFGHLEDDFTVNANWPVCLTVFGTENVAVDLIAQFTRQFHQDAIIDCIEC